MTRATSACDKSNERLSKDKRTYSDFLVENTLTWDGNFGLHHINLLGGITYEEENTDELHGWGMNLPEPYFLQLQNAETRDASSYEYKHARTSAGVHSLQFL